MCRIELRLKEFCLTLFKFISLVSGYSTRESYELKPLQANIRPAEDSAEYSAGAQISLQVGFCSLFKPSYAWNRLPVKKQTTVVGLSG